MTREEAIKLCANFVSNKRDDVITLDQIREILYNLPGWLSEQQVVVEKI
jgi:hypothetical protein